MFASFWTTFCDEGTTKPAQYNADDGARFTWYLPEDMSNSNSFIHVPITIFTYVKVYIIYFLIIDRKGTRKSLYAGHPKMFGLLGWLLVVVLLAPIRGGSLGICFVCWMLLRHCTEALVYSNHPRAAAASSYLALIFGRIASGVPWFLRSTAEPMQHPHQCWRWCRPW